jgi:ATP-binding cassette subfamily F protein 3
VELLVDALNKYEGSFILVSHDRYFISKAANKIWEIEDHQIKEFKGTYTEWVEWKERMAAQKQAASDESAPGKAQAKPTPKPEAKPASQPAQEKPAASAAVIREQKKELQKLQRQFNQLEGKIAKLKEEKTSLEAALADPDTYSNKEKFTTAEAAYQKNAAALASLNEEYEALFEKIIALEAEMD